MVTVKFYSHLRKVLGTPEAQLEARTVRELLDGLSARYGEDFTSRIAICKVYVNGSHVGFKKGRRTRIGPDDEVVILPPVAGG